MLSISLSYGEIFLPIAQINVFHGKTKEVIKHLTKSLIYIFFTSCNSWWCFQSFSNIFFLPNIPLEYESNRLVCELLCCTSIQIFFMSNFIQLYVRYIKLIFAIVRPKIILVFFNFGALLFLTRSSYFSWRGMHYNMIY